MRVWLDVVQENEPLYQASVLLELDGGRILWLDQDGRISLHDAGSSIDAEAIDEEAERGLWLAVDVP